MNKYYNELLESNKKILSILEEEVRLSWNKTNSEYEKLFNEDYKIEKNLDSQNLNYFQKRKYFKNYDKKFKYKMKSKPPEEFLNNFIKNLSDSFFEQNINHDKISFNKNINDWSLITIDNILSDNNLIFNLSFYIDPKYQSIYIGNISFYEKNTDFFVKYSISSHETKLIISPSGFFLVDDSFISLTFDHYQNIFSISLCKMYDDNLFLPTSSDYKSVINEFSDDYRKFFNLIEKIKTIEPETLQDMLLNPNFKVPTEVKEFLSLVHDINFLDEDSELISMFSKSLNKDKQLKLDVRSKNKFINKMINIKNRFK